MTPAAADAPPDILLALPGLLFVAIGAAILAWPRALIGLQLRMLEWQISWLKGRAAPVLARAFGAFFLLAGFGFFTFALTAPK